MKYLIICINLILSVTAYGQDEFTITKNGLDPRFKDSKIEHLTKRMWYEKSLAWIEENEKEYKLSIEDQIENEVIHLSSLKWNAVNLDGQYFNVRYKIRLSFVNGSTKFEPTEIQLKLNSKYDMGWKDFDLTDGTMYFKKDKVMRKYKSYINDLTALLNELNLQLISHWQSD